jgi:hypothetical protein
MQFEVYFWKHSQNVLLRSRQTLKFPMAMSLLYIFMDWLFRVLEFFSPVLQNGDIYSDQFHLESIIKQAAKERLKLERQLGLKPPPPTLPSPVQSLPSKERIPTPQQEQVGAFHCDSFIICLKMRAFAVTPHDFRLAHYSRKSVEAGTNVCWRSAAATSGSIANIIDNYGIISIENPT